MAKKPLEIDCIAGSQLRDTQGEMLSVEGADISELEAGKGRWNDNHGKGFFNSIGRITKAKKIFKKEDCEDARQEYYWDKVKAPYIYVKGYLYDDEDHPNARAAAAILRNIHKSDTPLQLKASVEGGVVARGIKDSSLLAQTKIHSVALTFTPANNNTLVEPVSLNKSDIDQEADIQLIKSVMHLAETNVPSFRHIVRDASATKVQNNLYKLVDLMKELGIEGDISIPSKQKILEKALEAKIESNVIKIHDLMTLLRSEEPMEKGVKNAIASAVTGAALTMAPSHISDIKVEPQAQQKKVSQAPSAEEVHSQIANQYPLLGAIGFKESSGGKNTKHQTMTSGSHKGHTAGGIYGMMPNSAKFILSKDPELAKKYPKLAEAAKDINANHRRFTDTFNNDHQAAADFAISHFNRNKNKTKSDQQLVYSWLNGLKGSWNKLKEGGHSAINSHPYVKDVMKKFEQLKNQKLQQNQEVIKAMVAGYGSMGAPTSQTGGAVIQTESLEQGRPSFKYITCNSCGKEQVHAKHQVKCRQCGQSMSFEKLYDAIRGSK
jgi:hypothetical protein